MAFDLDFLVSTSDPRPTPEQLRQQVEALCPNIEVSEGGARGAMWSGEYVNPETLVSFDFRCREASNNVINFCAYETGLSVSIPCVCPSFIPRESLPWVVKFAKEARYWLYTPSGQIIEKPDAAQLQLFWNEQNKRTLTPMSMGGDKLPFYFPSEKMDAMWNYGNARQQLVKRYDGRGIAVPRLLLIRNKLARETVFRAIFWTEFGPTVLPDVDAVVLSKPSRLLFGRFPMGELESTVVQMEDIADIIEPSVRKATRPFEHRLIEDVSSIRLPVLRKIMEVLPVKFNSFETVEPEEVIDVEV